MSIKQALMMTDWAAYADGISPNRDAFIWELILHSLLRDEVIIQEESLAQSEKLAEWFHRDDSFRILQELLSVGIIKILVQNPATYTDSRNRELATRIPIQTKHESIRLKHGTPFHPSETLKDFVAKLDRELAKNRPFRYRRDDTHQGFARRLCEALEDDRYERWFRNHGIEKTVRAEFARYVRHPESSKERFKRFSRKAVFHRKFDDAPIFSRNLGHQLADTFGAQKKALNMLIHSAYASVVSSEQLDADGRYNRWLEPLLPGRSDEDPRQASRLKIADVQYRLAGNLRLPVPAAGLGDVLRRIRTHDAYKQFRISMKSAGQQVMFEDQGKHWSLLAEALAAEVVKSIDMPVLALVKREAHSQARDAALQVGINVFGHGTAFLGNAVCKHPLTPLDLHLGAELATQSITLAVRTGVHQLRVWAQTSPIEDELKRAVSFCAPI